MFWLVALAIVGRIAFFVGLRWLCKKKPQFVGKTVLVTGASSGIGEHVCYEFSKLGANVILVSRRREELERVKNNLKMPENSHIEVMDMKRPEDVLHQTEDLMKNLEQRTGFKHLDILVMNAGISQREEFEVTRLDVFNDLFNVNFNSCVTMTKAVLPYMIAQKSGQIVGTSSIYGRHSAARRTSYSAAKHALEGFLASLRPEVSQHNISTTVISPGCIYTNVAFNSVLGDGRKMGVTDARIKLGMPADACAKEYVEAIYCKETVRVVGSFKEKATVFFSRISSRLEAWIALRSYQNILKKQKTQ